MASWAFASNVFSRRRVSLAEIDAAVSACLGPTQGLGNSPPACFNRQVGMYLASHESVFTLDSWIERVCQLFDGPAPPGLDSSQDEISGLPKRPLNMHASKQTRT